MSFYTINFENTNSRRRRRRRRPPTHRRRFRTNGDDAFALLLRTHSLTLTRTRAHSHTPPELPVGEKRWAESKVLRESHTQRHARCAHTPAPSGALSSLFPSTYVVVVAISRRFFAIRSSLAYTLVPHFSTSSSSSSFSCPLRSARFSLFCFDNVLTF